MREELLKGLTEEQIKKAEGCNSAEEVLALAKEEGITLSDEQLEAVSGGCYSGPKCPECGSKDYRQTTKNLKTCRKCGTIFS